MKRIVLVILIIVVAVLLVSVIASRKDSTREEVTESEIVDAPDSYVGEYEAYQVSPLETGLKEELSIKEDGTFIWSAEFMKSEPPYIQAGTWKREEDELILTVSGDHQREYANLLEYRFTPREEGIYNETDGYELKRI